MSDDLVTLHHPGTGDVRQLAAAAVPFFTNQGYQLPDPTRGRHEAPDDSANPGASTTPTTAPSKEK